jgi:hypothetical protein
MCGLYYYNYNYNYKQQQQLVVVETIEKPFRTSANLVVVCFTFRQQRHLLLFKSSNQCGVITLKR